MAQPSDPAESPNVGTQFPSARYVDWLQVQGCLDMAESALRAKNAANDVQQSPLLLLQDCLAEAVSGKAGVLDLQILMQEKAAVLQNLSQQTEQNIQVRALNRVSCCREFQ